MISDSYGLELDKAAKHLAARDAKLAPTIREAGLPTIRPHRDYYGALIHSIISQQLSVKAAAAIQQRFEALFENRLPTPDKIMLRAVEVLRTAGLSGAKATYIRDLARHIIEGKLSFERFDSLTNEEIIAELTAVKGIGTWTAHMFLIFCMGRLDVLPIGDLGIRNGVRKLYGLASVPTPARVAEIAESHHWHPYESVASWYVWHSLDNTPSL